ncbi:hypothetical protein Trydic_g13420 [Trypoxylus dichotomus]
MRKLDKEINESAILSSTVFQKIIQLQKVYFVRSMMKRLAKSWGMLPFAGSHQLHFCVWVILMERNGEE